MYRIDSIKRNGETGLSLCVAALKSASMLYETHAQTPQLEENVQRNTSKLMGAAYGIAQTGQVVANLNLAAYRVGADPRDVPSFLMALFKGGDPPDSFHASFSVASDTEGQLEFSPKFRRLGAVRDARCPALSAKVNHGERPVPALWSLMKVIGSVATTEIFPQQFAIASKGDPKEELVVHE